MNMSRHATVCLFGLVVLLNARAFGADDAARGRKELAAWWTFDGKPQKGRIADDSGRGHVAVIGDPVRGSDKGLPAGPGQAASISLWFKPSGKTAPQVLFCYGTTRKGQGRGIWMPDASSISLFHWGGPDLNVKIKPLATSAWHHVVGVYDARGRMRLYLDGKKLGEAPGRPDTRCGGSFYIARSLDGTKAFTGMIDDIAVFRAVLTAGDVAWLYNKGKGNPAGTLAGLKAATSRSSPPKTGVWAAGHIGTGALRFTGAPGGLPQATAPIPKDLGFDEIVFAVRQGDRDGHWYATFGYNVVDPKNRKYYHDGGRLCRLNLKTGEVKTILADPRGGVRDPQMHYDGKKILLSYRKGGSPYYNLYEINIDGSALKQLTGGPYDDLEPAYLPDGGIVFCSSRCNRWVPCYVTQVAILYRCDGDGKNIRQLSPNVEMENTPWVLPDGRVLYQRWEYVDRSQVGYHHLWTMNPDGTGQMVYFGNLHPNTVMIDAKPIPDTRKVVASFSPGHGRNEHAGVVTIVDPRGGPDARENARSISGRGLYRDPYPVGEDRFLVADRGDILLMGRSGRRTKLFSLPAQWRIGRMQVHEPRPLRPRKRERIIPPRIDPSKGTGHVVLENVYIGRNMGGVKRGEITDLLVLEILSKPYNMFSGMEPLSYGGTFLLERILGTVPVESDGSASMEMPAMRPLFFVALDKDGMSVKRMQSFMSVQPGERLSCIGCHEKRGETPHVVRPLLATRRPPSKIKPIAGVPDVMDFPRDIQPILDKHCVGCHGYEKTAKGGPRSGGVILTGDRGPMYSHSYYMLTVRKQFSDGRNLRKSNYAPRTIGSSASALMKKLDGDHNKVRLAPGEKQLIRLWIDTGATYPGTYAALGSGMLGHYSGSTGGLTRQDVRWPSIQAARGVVKRRCSKCHSKRTALPDSPSDNRGMVGWTERAELVRGGNYPILRFNRHILYNLSRPTKSLLLLAPLAPEGGGYGMIRKKGDKKEIVSVFKNTSDPDYKVLLQAVRDSKAFLDKITRFDMPSFRPRPEYIREMKRYGLPIPESGKTDVYRMDRVYWDSLLYRPKEGRQ